MRSHLLFTVTAAALSAAACATGAAYVGGGGGGTGAGATGTGNDTASSGASSTSSTASSSTSTGSTSSSSGACTASPCKLTSPQCGCTAPSACTISNYMLACELAGTTGVNQICASANTCQPGTLCIGSGTSGLCEQFCAKDGDCSNGICAIQLSDGMGGALPNVTVCTNTCDLQTGSGCPAGASCQVAVETTGAMLTYTYCTNAGAKGAGKSCTTASDCAPTFGCFNSPGGTTCGEYCYVNSAGACTGCSALTDSTTNLPIMVNGETVGTCP